MHRHELGDADWKRIEPLLPVRPGPRSKRGDRDFVNAVIWRVRTGVPWRDLPERFGAWKTVYNRFSRWAKRGVWERIFKALAIEVDEAGSLSTRPSSGRTKTPRAGKGGPTKSSGPFSRRRFDQDPRGHDDGREAPPRHADPGARHEALKAEELVEHARGKACIADSGYSSKRIFEATRRREDVLRVAGVADAVGATYAHTDVPAESARWLAYHPHLQRSARKQHTLFVGSDALQIDGRTLPGAGFFPAFSPPRVLSAPGENMSVWRMPPWMRPAADEARFSFIHDDSRWTQVRGETHVQTVGRGQEIVMTATNRALVDAWLADIFSDVPSIA